MMTTQTITLTIEGMTCGGCAKSVNQALQQLAGVNDAHANFEQKNATIIFDNEQISINQLVEAIEDAGFDVVQ